jgi:hypothetical protein
VHGVLAPVQELGLLQQVLRQALRQALLRSWA